MPWVGCDGASVVPADMNALWDAASASLLTDSPWAIAVEQVVDGGTITVTATVTAVGEVPAGELALRIGLVETEIHLDAPPGTNGETDFYNTMRDMLPGHAGTPLQIGAGESQVFVQSVPVDAAWNLDNIRAVAWVQDDATKQVLQAGSTAPLPDYASFFDVSERVALVRLGTTYRVACPLNNRGGQADVYEIQVGVTGLPAGWSGSVLVNGTSYPLLPFITALPLAPATQTTIQVDFASQQTPGTAIVVLAVISSGDPTRTWVCRIKAISSGVPILLVDNDDRTNLESYYQTALDATGRLYATWDHWSDGQPTAWHLEHFPMTVWSATADVTSLSAQDLAALGAYLDRGGRLFISDPLIAFSLCDALSEYGSAETVAWFNTYLGTDYVGTDFYSSLVRGVDDDPIGDRLRFTIGGGSSGGLFTVPLEVTPRSGAAACLRYDDGHVAGIRYDTGKFRVVYLPYGLENLGNALDREELLSRSLDWLEIDIVGVPDPQLPPLAVAPTAAPNPFNPLTRIAFTVGGSAPQPVQVTIHDLRGRLVRTLWKYPVAPGERSLDWDGRTDAGAEAASGVYLARVRVANMERSLKLTLAK